MQVPCKKSQVQAAAVGDEGLLLDTMTDQVAYCNHTAMVIYELCDGQRSVDDIAGLLQEAFPEAAEEIPTQVDASLQELQEAGLIELQ